MWVTLFGNADRRRLGSPSFVLPLLKKARQHHGQRQKQHHGGARAQRAAVPL